MDARIFSRKDLNQSYTRFETSGMKLNLLAALIIGALLFLAPGQRPLTAQPAPDAAPAPDLLSEPDLEQLVAPIALYPDPMVALILQASTVPTDIVLASRWLNDGNSPDDIDAQPWDDSVKGLARYPDVLQMMDDNLDWTNQLGAAVLAQQPDVMNAIQAMRAKAQALGNLQTTAQQQVISQDQVIQIVPADPQVIYVPVLRSHRHLRATRAADHLRPRLHHRHLARRRLRLEPPPLLSQRLLSPRLRLGTASARQRHHLEAQPAPSSTAPALSPGQTRSPPRLAKTTQLGQTPGPRVTANRLQAIRSPARPAATGPAMTDPRSSP